VILAGIFAEVAFCQNRTLVHPQPDYISSLESYNSIGYRSLLYPLHVSTSKRTRHHQHLQSRLQLCALERNVFTNVINLDKYNLFMLGIKFQELFMTMQHLLSLNQFVFLVTGCLLDIVKTYFSKRPKKPPDPTSCKTSIASDNEHTREHGLIACSSAISNDSSTLDIFTESFDSEEQVIIGLDSLCSRHLFCEPSNFVSELTPITPFKIHGVGGNISVVSKGNVRL
jgi:hypothetical protein